MSEDVGGVEGSTGSGGKDTDNGVRQGQVSRRMTRHLKVSSTGESRKRGRQGRRTYGKGVYSVKRSRSEVTVVESVRKELREELNETDAKVEDAEKIGGRDKMK